MSEVIQQDALKSGVYLMPIYFSLLFEQNILTVSSIV